VVFDCDQSLVVFSWCSSWLRLVVIGWRHESSVSVSPPTRAHTPLKKKKKISPGISIVVVTRRVLTKGYRGLWFRDNVVRSKSEEG
jgi:hypothetical protein